MIYFSGGALLWRTGKGISQGPVTFIYVQFFKLSIFKTYVVIGYSFEKNKHVFYRAVMI